MLVTLNNEIVRDALHLLFLSFFFLREHMAIQNSESSLWVIFLQQLGFKNLIKLVSLIIKLF